MYQIHGLTATFTAPCPLINDQLKLITHTRPTVQLKTHQHHTYAQATNKDT